MKRLVVLVSLALLWSSTDPQAQVARPHYLTPVYGTGTDQDPFRSGCLGLANNGNIDLRPLGIARFLCASDVLPKDMVGVAQLGASIQDHLDVGQKAVLNAIAGKTITATRIDDVIVELLAPALRAGPDGKLKIFLGGKTPIYQQTAWVPFRDGGLVADAVDLLRAATEPAIAWASTLATETFNCADSASITCVHTWTEIAGTTWLIASNQASSTGVQTAIARNDSSLSSTDTTAGVTLISEVNGGGSSSTSCGPYVRGANNGNETFYRHTAFSRATGELKEVSLVKSVAGAATVLSTDTTDWANNDVLEVFASGSSISGARNSVTINTATDVDITTGTYTGLRYVGTHASSNCTVDNFTAQDIATSSVGVLRRRAL